MHFTARIGKRELIPLHKVADIAGRRDPGTFRLPGHAEMWQREAPAHEVPDGVFADDCRPVGREDDRVVGPKGDHALHISRRCSPRPGPARLHQGFPLWFGISIWRARAEDDTHHEKDALHRLRSRRSSTSDMMNPNAGQPPDATERSNHARAWAVSPRTRYQVPIP